MMKRWVAGLLAMALMGWGAQGVAEVGVLVRGWAAGDGDAMRAVAAVYRGVAADVAVTYEAVARDGYEGAEMAAMRGGTGADLLYVSGYEPGLALWNSGLLLDLKDMPELEENFSPALRQPWSSPEGNLFAVPLYGAVHAVYCNIDLFRAHGLNPPGTWDEFVAICEALRGAGLVPLANAASDGEALFEDGFLAMLPNYVGGIGDREMYQSGERSLGDGAMQEALTDFAQLGRYLLRGASEGTSAMARFAGGEALMCMATSAEMAALDGAAFEWDVFAMPAHAAERTVVCFRPEAGIAVNPRGANVKAATDFLQWLAGPDGMDLLGNVLPDGHFPMIDAPMALDEAHENALLALLDGRESDVPFVRRGTPMYEVMRGAALSVIAGTQTPQGAADAMVAGFVPWV